MKPNNIVALALLVVGVIFLILGVYATASCTPLMQAFQNCTNTTWIWACTFLFIVGSLVAFLSGQ